MDSDPSSEHAPPPDRFQRLLETLFIGAVRDGNAHTVRGPIGEGVDPTDEFALIEAATFGHAPVLRVLLEAGANARADNDSPIWAAAENGHAETVRLLLEAEADYSVHNHAPLRRAEENGQTEVARILREAGSYNPDTPGDDPVTRARDSLHRRFPSTPG